MKGVSHDTKPKEKGGNQRTQPALTTLRQHSRTHTAHHSSLPFHERESQFLKVLKNKVPGCTQMSTTLCLYTHELPFLGKHPKLYIALVFSVKDKHKLRKLPFLFAQDHKTQQLLPKQSFRFQRYSR